MMTRNTTKLFEFSIAIPMKIVHLMPRVRPIQDNSWGPMALRADSGVPGGRIISKESLFSSRGIVHQQGNDCGAVDLAQEDSESLGPGGTGLCRSGVGWPDGGNSATARRRRVPRSNQQEGQEDRADPGADAGTPGRGQEGRLEEAVS